jgi:hypothetical protein
VGLGNANEQGVGKGGAATLTGLGCADRVGEVPAVRSDTTHNPGHDDIKEYLRAHDMDVNFKLPPVNTNICHLWANRAKHLIEVGLLAIQHMLCTN